MGVGGGYPPPPSKSRKKETMKRETILEQVARERQERWHKACQAQARLLEDIDKRRRKEAREDILFTVGIAPLCAFVAYLLIKLIA